MKRARPASAAFLAGAAMLTACSAEKPHFNASAEFTNTVLVRDVIPFGINLGTWTAWGAEQLSSNIVKNPGFEGMIDRAIVIVRDPQPMGFSDTDSWLARPDGFWKGARYEVLSGRKTGAAGEILSSEAGASASLPRFRTKEDVSGLAEGDAISVTRISDGDEPADWWFTRAVGARYEPVPEIRPASPGIRSLRVTAERGATAEAISYFDAIGDRAGKLLPLTGRWKLSFWSRMRSGPASLRVSFGRDGSRAVFLSDVPLEGAWRQSEFEFDGSDGGPPGIVALKFQLHGDQAHGDQPAVVLLDDVELRRADETDSAFRAEVRTVLARLRPGFLRDWQGQLGDTMQNRIQPPFARRTTRYRPGDAFQADYQYGLPEFLGLALDTATSPWIVIPTTFSAEECAGLGRYLASDQRYLAFHEVLTEFGNENWNAVFRPAGIPQASVMDEAADRCFEAVRRNAGSVHLRTVVNAQHARPEEVGEVGQSTRDAGIVAVAPYFVHSLPTGISPAEARGMLFEGDGGRMSRIATVAKTSGKELAVYEVSSHADEGPATFPERLRVTSGMASASALALTMLDSLALGARRQCVYALAGFDNYTRETRSFVRLWGVARDLGEKPRLRPSGLSLALMNRAIQGDMVRVDSKDRDVRAWGFRRNNHWSIVVASASAEGRSIDLKLPAGATPPTTMLKLVADSPEATNEDGDDIVVMKTTAEFEDQIATITLAPYGLAVLVDREAGEWELPK